MLVTNATLDALRTQFSAGFGKAYEATPIWWNQVASEVPSSTKQNTYGWVAQVLKMRKWVGPRVIQNLSEHAYVLPNEPFEATVDLDRDEIEDDNLGQFSSMIIPSLAEAARKDPDDQLAEKFFGNTLVAFDGKLYFATDHPVYDEAATTYSNLFTLALNEDNFETVWTAMVSYKGEDGRPLKIMPNKLVVPPQLKRTAQRICTSNTVVQLVKNVAASENVAAATVDNMLRGWAEPLVLPELAARPTTWHLGDFSKIVKPAILQMRRPAQFVSRDKPDDAKVFDQKKFTYGVDGRWAVGVTLPFLCSRSTPAP